MSNQNMPSHHGEGEQPQGNYPNETMRLLMERASLRNFADRKIPPEVLQQVLDAGNHAATGGNLQPYSIIKIENESTRAKLAEWCEQSFIARAPVNLVFCIDMHRIARWAELEVAPFSAHKAFRHFWISFQDTIIAAQSICNAADAMGLGSVYIGTIMEHMRQTIELLKLPQMVLPVVLLCLGYPASHPEPRRKLGVDVIVHSETYQDPDDETLLQVFENKYPGARIEVNDERLQSIEKVCREVHGAEFAARCLERIQQNGYIRTVQRYFGLHYTANEMPALNQIFLQTIEEAGFEWFKEFKKFE